MSIHTSERKLELVCVVSELKIKYKKKNQDPEWILYTEVVLNNLNNNIIIIYSVCY